MQVLVHPRSLPPILVLVSSGAQAKVSKVAGSVSEVSQLPASGVGVLGNLPGCDSFVGLVFRPCSSVGAGRNYSRREHVRSLVVVRCVEHGTVLVLTAVNVCPAMRYFLQRWGSCVAASSAMAPWN